MLLLDGKIAQKHILKELRKECETMKASGQRAPHLVAVLVGEDGGSQTYVANKMKTCEEIGFKSTLHHLAQSASQEQLLELIHQLNEDSEVDGFIVQLPLPKHIDEAAVIEAVDFRKDVDGFHPINAGRLMKGMPAFLAATPMGIMKLLEHYQITTKGKHAVVVGRSNIVGTPMAILLSRNTNPGNCTVTLCHSHTKNIKEVCLSADILVVALGKPDFLKAEMVKEGAVVIDVGTTRVDDPSAQRGWRLKGDVAFNEVKAKASAITPVPGGVGPMTIAGLMFNTMLAAKGTIYPKEGI